MPENRIKVLLVLGDKLAQRGLRGALEEYEDIQVVGEAGDAVEAMRQVTAACPNVIVMDADIPFINGLETTRLLNEKGYPGAVIVLSTDALHLQEAVDSGATEYLISDAPPHELVAIIRRVPEGRFVFGGSVMSTTHGLEIASRYISGQETETTQLQPQTPVTPETTEIESVEGVPKEALGGSPAGEDDTADDATAEQLPTVDESAIELTSPAPEPQGIAEPLDSPRTSTWDTPIMEVELVFSHPAALTKVLELHQWLTEISSAAINEMAGSPGGDTVVRASLGRAVPLMRLLAELPDVVNVTEEPYGGGSEMSSSVSGVPGLRQDFGIGRALPTRLRIVLKSD